LCKENSFDTENDYFYQKLRKMKQTFEITRSNRDMLTQFLNGYSLEQLNKIPEGHSNNLIWNIGHIVVVQQMLVYKLSGLPMMIPDEMVSKYKKGSKPEQDVSQEEVDEIRSFLYETINRSEKDFENQTFSNYMEFTTMTGFTIKNATDALHFNNYHEALHVGIMMGIRKFI
jgi:hypothetical protein